MGVDHRFKSKQVKLLKRGNATRVWSGVVRSAVGGWSPAQNSERLGLAGRVRRGWAQGWKSGAGAGGRQAWGRGGAARARGRGVRAEARGERARACAAGVVVETPQARGTAGTWRAGRRARLAGGTVSSEADAARAPAGMEQSPLPAPEPTPGSTPARSRRRREPERAARRRLR